MISIMEALGQEGNSIITPSWFFFFFIKLCCPFFLWFHFVLHPSLPHSFLLSHYISSSYIVFHLCFHFFLCCIHFANPSEDIRCTSQHWRYFVDIKKYQLLLGDVKTLSGHPTECTWRYISPFYCKPALAFNEFWIPKYIHKGGCNTE